MSRTALCSLFLIGLLTGCPASGPGQLTPAENYSSPLTFSNGQTAQLNLKRQGTDLSGELTIAARTGTQQFTQTINTGTYSLTGTYSPPRTYSLTGTFPAPLGSFSFSGQLPTAGLPGSYLLTAGGQSLSGILPALSGSSASASPIPSSSPSPAPSASASVAARTWTIEQLQMISYCFSTKVNSLNSNMVQAYARSAALFEEIRAKQGSWTASERQTQIDAAGEAMAWYNTQYSFGCVDP